jgi:transcriptional regulator with XRE-family HTH domain
MSTSKSDINEKKRAKLTDEQRDECDRLKAIWQSRWKERGRTQEDLAEVLGITPGAISLVMNKRMAIPPKLAPGFAAAFGCEVAEFSPRLAELLHVRVNPQADPDPYAVAREHAAAAEPSSVEPGAITAFDALEHLSRTMQSIPDRHREDLGRQLALLASLPDSPMLVRRIAMALAAYDRPTVPSRVATATRTREPSFGQLIGQKLDQVPPTQRTKLFALIEGFVDLELGKLEDDTPTTEQSTPDLEPTPAPAPHP